MERLDEFTNAIEIERRARSVVRAVIALARSYDTGVNAETLVKGLWPTDKNALDAVTVTRGAVTPLATTTAGAPIATGFATLLPLLGPVSASGGFSIVSFTLAPGKVLAQSPFQPSRRRRRALLSLVRQQPSQSVNWTSMRRRSASRNWRLVLY
jgi:hypothetical protein